MDNANQQGQGAQPQQPYYTAEEYEQRRQEREQRRQVRRQERQTRLENWERTRQHQLTSRGRLGFQQRNLYTEGIPSTRETSQTRSPIESLTNSPEGSTQTTSPQG